jgi:hypothetical protein
MRQSTDIGQSPCSIIDAALRAAVLAPTIFDALDVTGAALRRLRDIARADAVSTDVPHALNDIAPQKVAP